MRRQALGALVGLSRSQTSNIIIGRFDVSQSLAL
jgi:hypothetical protein